MATDLRLLFDFISANAGGPLYRDLQRLYLDKGRALHTRNIPVREIITDALDACGLDLESDDPSTLNDPGEDRRRAAAAVVLASALVRGTPASRLPHLYHQFLGVSAQLAVGELRSIMQTGRRRTAPGLPHLTLVDFINAGLYKGRWVGEFGRAYSRSERLLRVACTVLAPTRRLSVRVERIFERYFGPGHEPVTNGELLWNRDSQVAVAPLFVASSTTRRDVVAEVLSRTYSSYQCREPIDVCLGGTDIEKDTWAYTDSAKRPPELHLGEKFFRSPKNGLGSQAGTLIHEMSHLWARTADHAYTSRLCVFLWHTSVGMALTNADSYAYFVEEAFGG